MCANCVQRDGQFACDLRPGQIRRQISQHLELARAEFLCQRRGVAFGGQGGAAYGVEDVGEQCGVRCLMLRQSLEQWLRARHRERQDEPVRFGEGECAVGGLVRRALVTELTVGEPGQQVSLYDCDVTDDWCRAV